MGVADKAVGGVEVVEVNLGAGGGDHILPYGLPGAAVDQGKVTLGQAQGQVLQVLAVLPAQLCRRPSVGGGGIGIEVGDIDFTYGRPVVIARYAEVAVPAEKLQAPVGFGAIADDVPQAPDLLGPSPLRYILENGLEGNEIGMDIGKKGKTHREVQYIRIEACCESREKRAIILPVKLPVKLSDIGEFGLIDRIAGIVGGRGGLKLGIGDDAAAWECDGRTMLATMDSLVQGVHFSLDLTTWEDLGWKALAVNLSDIAAMGGEPRCALVSLSLPQDTDVEDVEAFYRGMEGLGRTHDVTVAGGDLTVAPQVSVSIAVMGWAEGDALLTRSAAQAGDLVAVTGYLGASTAGLRVAESRLQLEPGAATLFREAHFRPRPRVGEGRALVRAGVRAAIDVSDGLLADLGHICRMSAVSARIGQGRIPLAPGLEAAFGDEALPMALEGGEDYEILFAAGRDVMEGVVKGVECPITVIGEIEGGEPGRVTLVDEQGNIVRNLGRGWEHFVSTGYGKQKP